jgi:hypothetical protein
MIDHSDIPDERSYHPSPYEVNPRVRLSWPRQPKPKIGPGMAAEIAEQAVKRAEARAWLAAHGYDLAEMDARNEARRRRPYEREEYR